MTPDRRLLPDLAARIAGLRAAEIDATTVEAVRLHGFDAMGCTAAGAATSEIGATRQALMHASFLSPPKSLLDYPGCAAAVLVTACRLTECDDIHIASCTTPSSVVIPVALVAGYVTKAMPETVVEAILAGYQTMITLGLAARGAEIVYRGVWPTFLTGGITTAAIAAKAMGLSEQQICNAMAIAAASATGVTGRIEGEPSPRWLVLASAVQGGFLAAAAAASGLQGDDAILGKVSPAWNPETIQPPDASSDDRSLHVNRTGFKPYCTSRQGLSATEAFRTALQNEKIAPNAIEKITVEVPQHYRAMIDRTNRPQTKTESRGIHYQLALAALHPEELCDIERTTLRAGEAAMQHILDRVEVIASERLTKLYPRQWGGAVTVAANGRSIRHEILHPRGDPENPLGWSDITVKLKAMSRYLRRPISVEELATQARALDFRAGLETLLDGLHI